MGNITRRSTAPGIHCRERPRRVQIEPLTATAEDDRGESAAVLIEERLNRRGRCITSDADWPVDQFAVRSYGPSDDTDDCLGSLEILSENQTHP